MLLIWHIEQKLNFFNQWNRNGEESKFFKTKFNHQVFFFSKKYWKIKLIKYKIVLSCIIIRYNISLIEDWKNLSCCEELWISYHSISWKLSRIIIKNKTIEMDILHHVWIYWHFLRLDIFIFNYLSSLVLLLILDLFLYVEIVKNSNMFKNL